MAFECAMQSCHERSWVFHVEGVTVFPHMRRLDADDLAKAAEDSALAEPESWIPRIEAQADFLPHRGWTKHVGVLIRDDSDLLDLVEGNVNRSAFAQEP